MNCSGSAQTPPSRRRQNTSLTMAPEASDQADNPAPTAREDSGGSSFMQEAHSAPCRGAEGGAHWQPKGDQAQSAQPRRGTQRDPVSEVITMKTLRHALVATLLCLPLIAHSTPSVQVGFSPEGSARALVLTTIASARHHIRMLAYAFQAPDIVQALVAAEARGVQVEVVIDKKRNENKTSRAAMDAATRGGVMLRTNDHFHIHHDKTIIVDDATVETGSFNFAPSAETLNSENLVVMKGMPDVARQYLAHWQSRWALGVPYHAPDQGRGQA